MYSIYCDNKPIYIPNSNEYGITDGKLTLKVNSSGTLQFGIDTTNPNYNQIKLMKSIITLYDDDTLVFRGRPYAPNQNFFNQGSILCEGELAFFNDTFFAPFDYELGTVEELFRTVIENHNSQVPADKQFQVGTVNVTNSTSSGMITRSSIDYMTTWEVLRTKFFESSLGGYLWVRHENGVSYIDYLSDLNYISNQSVEQCINVTNAKKKTTSTNLATVIVPLGAKLEDEEGVETDERLTIASVNDGKVFIEDANGIDEFGYIVRITTHDGITDASNLLAQGMRDLGDALGADVMYEIQAVDLSKCGYEVSPLAFGSYVRVRIQNLNVDSLMLINSLSINLLNPASNSITLGSAERTFTAQTLQITDSIGTISANLSEEKKQTQQSLMELQREVMSTITQTTNSIMTQIVENYYNTANVDELIASLSTQIQQTAEAITFVFNQFEQDINGQFSDISKYIRFEGGDIVLGVAGNEFILRIQNDKIAFLENNVIIAYWQNKKFNAVDGEFTNSLKLGKFAFIPRANGNLSFKKVVD